MRRTTLLLLVVMLATFACSGDDGGAATDDTGSAPDTAGSGEPAQGVTDDSIKIGFAYMNLDDIREAGLIDINHGPYDEHIQALVDDLNAAGGIHGRMIDVIPVAYDPIGDEAQQAACLELTEDEEVFAVLGQVRGDNVLCFTEQHETIAVIDRAMNQERLDRSGAPYATAGPSWERILEEFVATAADEGLLEGRTVAVHSTEPANHAITTDVLVPALKDAGVDVAFESLLEVSGADVGAASEAVALNTEAMRDLGVDTVFVVGDALVVSNGFLTAGYEPTIFLADMGSAQALAIDADLSVFESAYTFGDFIDSERHVEETFQDRCVPIWDAAHPDDPVVDPAVVEGTGEPSHMVGLGVACRTFTIFAAAAEAAGADLDNTTFAEGLEAVGEIQIPGYGPGFLGPGRYDAQEDLVLYVYDPTDPDGFRGFARYEG